jgi:hypothetical protein
LLGLAARRAKAIRKATRNRPAQIRNGPVATVKKPLSEATRQIYQSGLRVLEALLSSGLIEYKEYGHFEKCKSKSLQGSFFSELGLTPRGTFDCLANLSRHASNGLLDYNGRGGPMVGGLNLSLAKIANDLHVFSFEKSLSELNQFTSRIKQLMEEDANG